MKILHWFVFSVVHQFCKSAVRKLFEYPSSCHNETLCSSVYYTWNEKEGLDAEGVKKKREALNKLLNQQLIQLAATAQVWVMQHVDGKSCKVSELMVARRLVATNFGVARSIAFRCFFNNLHIE
jgi:hypothetical protein